MIKTITSKDNANIKFAVSLKENKNRKKYGMFLAETKKALEMALEQDLVDAVFTLEWLDIKEEIKQYLVSEEVLKKLSSNVNPEVVFISKIPTFENRDFHKILYLDEVNDPGNLGTLIRTALAFNYDAVITSDNSCSIYNEKCINASKGAIFKIPAFTAKLEDYLNTHQIIVSTLENDSIDLEEVKLEDKYVLVLGNESHGVKKETSKVADVKVKIKIDNIDSLNVALAGAILMYKLH